MYIGDNWGTYFCSNVITCTVQITFIFICQTHLVFRKCVCTCFRKHLDAVRTSLNWLKNLKCVGMNRIFTFCVSLVSEIVICEHVVGLV